jgi:diacylglycerol kinase family enzyme
MKARYLWLAAAAGLALSGNRHARRAALRGSGGALASLGVLRAARALVDDGPSERAAAAAAFAVGAGMELPPAGAAAGALAALEIYSDDASTRNLLIGAAVGAGIAYGSKRAWPVAPREESEAPKALLPSHAEPSPEGDGLTVAFNLASGSDLEEEPTDEVKSALPKAKIVKVDPDKGEELRKALDDAIGAGAIALGIVGGDGSINTAAQVALDSKKALMVVPSGTFNHLTSALGIDSVDEAIDAVKAGEAVGVDVGTIDGHVFLNTASFGSYVALVDAREKLEDRIGKWPAIVVALWRVLRKAEPVDVEIDGEPHKVWMAFIGNCRYRPSGFAPTWRERLDDEVLDFRYVDGNQPWSRSRLIAAVLTGTLGRSRVYKQTVVQELRIKPLDGKLRLARDGETFEGSDDILVCKHEQRLAIYAPHKDDS